MADQDLKRSGRYSKLIWVLSIGVPIVVALLFRVRIPGVERLGFLPPIYATLNGITAILLVVAFWQIKKGNRKIHERIMKVCILFSAMFLVLYVAYHMTSDPTPFGGEGVIKYIYYFVLISHIVLSVLVIPFVLISYFRAISGNFESHKRIARYSFPLWLYVAITGVIVYILISPYY